MNRSSVSLFICPECGLGGLHLEEYVFNSEFDQVEEGRLICVGCQNWYRIENSIVDLLPSYIKKLNHERFVVKDIRFSKKYGLPMPGSNVVGAVVSSDKTKPLGAFEDVVNYEKDVVENRFYQALDQTAFIDWMLQHLKTGDLILDIGCGSGRQSIPFAEAGMQVVGLDVDEDMVLLAAKKLKKRSLNRKVDLLVADGENPPVKDNYFRACILYGVLHHLTAKDIAVLNASRKIMSGGLMYTLDPHKSFMRFMFDFFMKIWRLWVEEASADPLITEAQIQSWMEKGGVYGKTRLSTYLPPHIFLGGQRFNVGLLRLTDIMFSRLPVIRKAGGVIIFEGQKH